VGQGKRSSAIFRRNKRPILSDRRIVDRGDVERQRAGGGVGIDARVGRAAVVLDLEGQAGEGRAVGVERRLVAELAGADGGRVDALAGGDRRAAQRDGAASREGDGGGGLERVGGARAGRRRVVRIGEAEVGQ